MISEPLKWDTQTNMRRAVRLICDDEGFPLERNIPIGKKLYQLKDLLCATVKAEGGGIYNPKAKNENRSKSGALLSTDWGICQINDKYHIGQGKSFPSVGYVLDNPEACIRWMCKQWLVGHRDWWIAYKVGLYKKYL